MLSKCNDREEGLSITALIAQIFGEIFRWFPNQIWAEQFVVPAQANDPNGTLFRNPYYINSTLIHTPLPPSHLQQYVIEHPYFFSWYNLCADLSVARFQNVWKICVFIIVRLTIPAVRRLETICCGLGWHYANAANTALPGLIPGYYALHWTRLSQGVQCAKQNLGSWICSKSGWKPCKNI